ncbi:hypothetical protein [Cupriavidus oxalaticus]|uniref:Uncharacterized protein n=1 Tax=Cupriavidus oxalaticus TaxID=96344 RepID=A0A4V1BZJ5_9BURK|nr:hypothetical protein [Cupriavidus oxalaticus]QBY55542.1 hypothetical protein E0W60_31520 [Cupriavidus oxalaticus]
MTNPKQFVLSRFLGASVRRHGDHYLLEGVPGLVMSGFEEAAVWADAAKDLSDPVFEAQRTRNVLDKVMAAFAALGGQMTPMMALSQRLEQAGYSAAEAASAIEVAIASGALVLTAMGALQRP